LWWSSSVHGHLQLQRHFLVAQHEDGKMVLSSNGVFVDDGVAGLAVQSNECIPDIQMVSPWYVTVHDA
jgi:hypothetical protein